MTLFEKGNFQPIDTDFLSQGMEALQPLKDFQDRKDLWDTDTVINEIRDAFVAQVLDYDLINKEKHGFDAKQSNTGIFLEIKNCSYSAKSFGGTWNDTTIEKARAFQTNRVFTALGIWRGATDLLCIIYGQNKGLGEYLEEKVNYFKKGNTVRSTQSISATCMLEKYDFKIIPGAGYKRPDIARLLISKNKNFNKFFQGNKV